MTVDLSAFQLTATTKPEPVAPNPIVALSVVGNLFYDLMDLSDLIAAVTAKRDRIVARLDDPTIEATQAQRGEAEARAGALWAERERNLKDVRRKALAVVRAWGDLTDDDRRFVIEEAFPLALYDGVAAVIGNEQTLMGMGIWRSLVSGRDERKERIAS